VAHHGFETYWVQGEGVLSEAGEGRVVAPVPVLADAAASMDSAVPPFRFSRMGPKGTGKQLGEPNHRRIARAMTSGGGGFGNVPAGYTYLGQFVDHDLTFDKTSVALGENVPLAQLLQARSPSLDLDSLYGAGPGDPNSAKFYSDGMHLKMGKTDKIGPPPLQARDGFDLPRVGGSGSKKKQREALIPDPRNDENLAVAQTHLAMIRFHNRVVDSLPNAMPATQKFAMARDIVTRHYQWMLRHDYLPRIAAPGVVSNVFNQGRKAFEVGADAMSIPTMPIEFSIAAFRLGHSMVREVYDWNAAFPSGNGTLDFLFTFSGLSGDFFGGVRLPSNWIADWRRLYDFKKEQNRNDLAPPGSVNKAMRIDTRLAPTLHFLRQSATGDPTGGIHDDLAFRNLRRARMVRLATGQQMVTFLKSKGVTVTKLTKAQLRDGKNGADLNNLTPGQRDGLFTNTPLWFYILREAELNNGKLDGVGARIVAETFHRAMEGSTSSIVRDPAWRPNLGPNNTTFRMTDLLMFAFEGKKNLLAPLGDQLGGDI
jgi:Animal haem peroxidase